MGNTGRTGSALPPEAEGLQGLRVLVVEDHAINREIVSKLLLHAGVQAVLAGNGREALDELERDAGFDAVLMDLQMPELDGYGAARAIRADPRWAGLPIVALTASALPSEGERCRQAGMNAILVKPYYAAALYAVLRPYARGTRAVTATPAVPHADAPPEFSPHPLAAAGFDVARGLAFFGGDRRLFVRALRQFRTQGPAAAAGVRRALTAGDRLAARREAHTLGGLAGCFGADELREVAAAVETALDLPGAPEEALQWLDELTQRAAAAIDVAFAENA